MNAKAVHWTRDGNSDQFKNRLSAFFWFADFAGATILRRVSRSGSEAGAGVESVAGRLVNLLVKGLETDGVVTRFWLLIFVRTSGWSGCSPGIEREEACEREDACEFERESSPNGSRGEGAGKSTGACKAATWNTAGVVFVVRARGSGAVRFRVDSLTREKSAVGPLFAFGWPDGWAVPDGAAGSGGPSASGP